MIENFIGTKSIKKSLERVKEKVYIFIGIKKKYLTFSGNMNVLYLDYTKET